MAALPAHHRRQQIQEEDATKLQFGDFAEGEALTLTEVATLLKAARQAPNVPPAPDNKVYQSTTDYVNEFSNTTMDVSDSMRTALSARHGFLNKFEIAQIMSLRPERVEVAVALIPSLERYAQGDENEAQLQSLLDDVRAMVRYGVQP
ncbi:DNA-directed RNA polymerase II subunit RPB4 [Cryptococcus neoformans]|uniref:DNA-directed RNA polymerase II subunit RPB4 n=2 Tax=Cryptococcus neoformans TaxID=5207 RepID=A0A854QCX5_CRYNE|nr:DNA-directed RNA polymerase II subunit RPB4 [Cryptococcus neoformans var. grubii H99]AUB24403.1 DNA-directed RNA polymerase II subunit RPB4 [Cryptococcus neoformans var. grubii]OWT39687.1 DNA-directed RNA polymerase II subunit RPB4 [Cryptococcus neoformans var. grubii Bt1]OWZ32157.1 DNA-directed RNA polymerase II subunit RPB4 [Cryptococcus neoformans var. grubii AD2-60a]OWZ44826.1 DNA-directed RNA polymerase II subunit RPB4 [Cryptococcus neoformans var. grubii C23]OWZ48440.1 DNA-directed RN|eukprot:XP_012048930.1 DNA-directed RNA polymerase II subunit RPB4 [Cryptococcus neoformans var. grubii H99]